MRCAVLACRGPGLGHIGQGTISKGRFVQGAQHPRTFSWGHIGRGHINPASLGFLKPNYVERSPLKCIVILRFILLAYVLPSRVPGSDLTLRRWKEFQTTALR